MENILEPAVPARGTASRRAPSGPRTGFESWAEGVDGADERWNAYDCDIRAAVGEYDRHLSNTPGYVPLDWRVVKAMLWVETGGRSPAWKIRPMQIGNPQDVGLMALLGDAEGGELIVPPFLRATLSIDSVRKDPVSNIRAGIGYLLMRLATFDFRSIPHADQRVYEVVVKDGDSLERVAKRTGSTSEVLNRLNPAAGPLRPGQTLKYQKASIQKVIIGWRPLASSTIAARYNAGDPLYARKLDYALRAVRAAGEASCR